MEQQVLAWITHDATAIPFSLLVLGIVHLPVPDETLLTFTGYPVHQGICRSPARSWLRVPGSTCGITFSHTRPHFRLTLIHRYGRYLRITEAHVHKAHAWFRKAGHWSLTIGYFIPGARHFTAYAAGMSVAWNGRPSHFYAYSGRGDLGGHVHRPGLLTWRACWKSVQCKLRSVVRRFGVVNAPLALAGAGYFIWREVGPGRKLKLAGPKISPAYFAPAIG